MTEINVLIVEDDLISSEYLKDLCEDNGINVCISVDNSKDAIAQCKQKKPDIILMDIMIQGGISGCETALQIRIFNQDVVIIFLTAYSSQEMIEYALDAKAYSYLLKPYRDTEIISTIKMAINEKLKVSHKDMFYACKNGFSYNNTTHKFSQYDSEIHLTKKLLLLVKILISNKSHCVSYSQLCHSIWGTEKSINTLRALIYRLKEQLPQLDIHTVPSQGYVLY